jgi:hypothetical protein
MLGRMCGPRRDEVTGSWRELHNEELHNPYSSPSTIRMFKSKRMRWAGHVALLKGNVVHIGFGRTLKRPRRRREDNIEMKRKR